MKKKSLKEFKKKSIIKFQNKNTKTRSNVEK